MSDKKEEMFSKALMILVLIFILFFSSVIFGQVVSLPYGKGAAIGTIYNNDGTNPLFVADANDSYIELHNVTTNLTANRCFSDAKGLYTTKPVSPGYYYLIVYFKNNSVGNSTAFAIKNGQYTKVNLQTSRVPTS